MESPTLIQELPELVVQDGDLPATAQILRDRLAASNLFFDVGVPVKVVRRGNDGRLVAMRLTLTVVVIEAHLFFLPVKLGKVGERVHVTLLDRVARMFLEMQGEWHFRPLAGITTAPILAADGTVRNVDGYDPSTCLLCSAIPALEMPDRPTLVEAQTALHLLRQTFRTFPFADACRHWDKDLSVDVVDISRPPGRDESAFLVGLLTAVCRPYISLAPGLLLRAASISGAGTGKGLLVRAICQIAFGIPPMRSQPETAVKN
jgi:hypothetical protein